MKILFCTNVFETIENGPVKFANLLLGINRLYPEHELRILTEDTSAARPNVYKVPMNNSWRKSPLSQLIRMGVYHREAMRLRREFPFDVLVYNNALVGLLSAYRFPRTVGMINDDNNLGSGNFSLSQGRIKQAVFRFFEKSTARRAHRILVNSDYLRDTIRNAYGLPAEKIGRLYKGVTQPERIPERRSLLPDATIRVLFVKNDYRRGGLAVLAEALRQLPFRFELTIIGPNPADKKAIHQLFEPVATTTVRNLGKRNQEEVEEEMQRADLLCVPSYREALGVANLEAMACGLPVISTQVGGIPEVLDHGRCGWLVPPGDPVALAEAIRECLTNPNLREQKLRAAAERVWLFSVEAMYRNFLNILSE
jgi:colanic acid/amylovoran biosynthesis glycosyltransferase